MSSETYSVSLDTPKGLVNEPLLINEILGSSITTVLIGTRVDGDTLTITFISAISGPEKTTLDGIINVHCGDAEFISAGDTISNLSGTGPPSINDDVNDGFDSGSFWLDQSSNDAYILLTNTAGAAVWKNINKGDSVRNYNPSSTDPTTPTPQPGDLYYNTSINHLMSYDGTRSKWLSVTTFMDGAGRNGSTSAGGFYRRWNGMILSNVLGPVVPKGTIVRIGYSTQNSVTHTYEVLVDGVVISSLSSGGAASASDDTLNNDFDSGIMSSRNATGGSSTTDFQSVIYYKLRA